MLDCLETAAARHRVTVAGRQHVARVEAHVNRDYEPLAVADDTRIVRLVRDAASGLTKTFKTRATGAASDANVFAARGLEVANLGCGMRQIHTVNEWVDVNDMVATTELLVETVRLHTSG
jgi:tripeptide aminopeptidase